MQFKLWLENANSFIAYHQTSVENALKIKRNRRFSIRKSTQGIIWFTTDLESLRDYSTGAQSQGAILKLQVTMNNPAGWQEYDQLLLVELKSRGYDGAILPHGDVFDGFVFDPRQIKILGIVDLT